MEDGVRIKTAKTIASSLKLDATDITAGNCSYVLSAGVLLKATLGRATYVLIRSVKTNKALLLTEVIATRWYAAGPLRR